MIHEIPADFKEYLASAPKLDYVMVDPPWNCNNAKSKLQVDTQKATKYEYWSTDNLMELVVLFNEIEKTGAKAIALWTTLPFLADVFEAAKSTTHGFEYRTMITWAKRYESGKQAGALAHYFRNTTEQLVILKHKKAKGIPRTKLTTLCEELRRERTIKPKELESELINTWGGKWAYIFSGLNTIEFNLVGDVSLDCVDIALGEKK